MNEKMHGIFVARSEKTTIQFFRYLLVGGMAFIVDFSLLYILTSVFNVYYLISAAIAFICGLVVNYLMSIRWVFNQRAMENKSAEFLIFALIGIIGLFFNEVFIWVFTELVLLHYLISKILTTFFVLIWNFTARKYILFNKAR